MTQNMSTEKIVNGVNVDNLFNTIMAVKGNPEIAKFTFKASNNWISGGNNRTTVSQFYGACQEHSHAKSFEYMEDEPAVLLGKDQGANPTEYALAALAGCLTTSLIYHAAARGIKIDQVESTLSGNIDLQGFLGLSEKIRNGFNRISVSFKIEARGVPRDELEKLVELAQSRSPVFDMITNATPVEVRLEA
ncbi:MAG: OsmC family protein [Nitrososphaera sp.]|jgi:uncharacterized OsmC-like protein